MIRSLRVRHGFAGTLALVLLVAVWRLEPKVVIEIDLAEMVHTRPIDQPTVLSHVITGEPEPTDPPIASGSIGPIAPLTGLALDRETPEGPPPYHRRMERPALFVKIDNHPRARPQTGLDLADIVFDLRAEGVTRFAAVYHSSVPDPVGPVRSSRTSDFDLVRGFGTSIYASSGGNDYVTAGLRKLPIIELTNRTRNEYFRDFSRPAPHNLYVMGSDLYALAPTGLPSPQSWFHYVPSGEEVVQGEPFDGEVTVVFTGSPVVRHRWNATLAGWERTQDGQPHLTSGGDQLAPENVIIMVTDYQTSRADVASPEVVSVGSGSGWALTAGRRIELRWERPTPEDPLHLLTLDGDPVLLAPGRTWVLMPEEGQTSFE